MFLIFRHGEGHGLRSEHTENPSEGWFEQSLMVLKKIFRNSPWFFFIAKQSYLGQGNYYSIFLHPNLKRFSDSGKTILKNVTKFDWNWSCCSEGKYVFFNYQWMLCVPNLNEIKRKMRNVCMITCADQIVSVWNLKKNDFRINMIQ